MRLWSSYRSAGIKVSREVWQGIRQGDVARSKGEWRRAADSYEQVLARRPDLYHIHVQLGHAHKELGDYLAAEHAYRQARMMFPGDRDATLHLGHILKLRKQFDAAARCYVELAIADPDDFEAMREARDAIGHTDQAVTQELAGKLLDAHGDGGPTSEIDARWPLIEACGVVFDASGLLHYFSVARRPTGIQRVQIETLTQALRRAAAGGEAVGVCCFIDGRDEWVAVPPADFLHVAGLSVAEDTSADREWDRARDRLHLTLLSSPAMKLAECAILVNLGTSWSSPNYFLQLRDVQRRFGVVYVPMIYDMIPAIFPEYCIDTLIQDFLSWLSGVFDHTSAFLAISEASKRDLIAVADRMGRTIPGEAVEVVPLNADFGGDRRLATAAAKALASSDPFILLVSTIEPRKGHIYAFEALQELLLRHGVDATPRLVCVGNNGWLNGRVFDWLAANPATAEKVTVLSGISDEKLGELYEECLFSIYPSLYEGWGLPVTEALVRGKVVITTTSSSLPEAGGSFATYVPPADAPALADAIDFLLRQPEAREAAERRIKADFHPRQWSDIADAVADKARRLGRRAHGLASEADRRHPPIAQEGRFYWLSRSFATLLRPSLTTGERFRQGGWHAPSNWGNRTRATGATIEFRPAPANEAPISTVFVTVRLVGSDRRPCSFTVRSNAAEEHGVLAKREHLSVVLPVTVDADGVASLRVIGATAAALAEVTPGGGFADPTGENDPQTVGVAGFGFASNPDCGLL